MNKAIKIVGGGFLIFIGLSVILGLLGIHLGGLLGVIIGAALLYWGYSRWEETGQWSFSTIVIIALGALILFGGIGGLFSLLLGALFLYGGYRLIVSKKTNPDVFESDFKEESSFKSKRKYDSFDDEFDRLMNK
ncbi:hypothetical protein [Alkalihalobacillus pseudalcaliphilus]|uniref:hypothetical protein n=1 Tax=Alkalihalobacillus pseudalcaliphilus TaxID=79884 RepID=UPI00064D8E21|nr:hypothetical protein [Alkalihalobacillus pseudalcaliphilus]KMK75695.1 Lia membrane protein [Alkalihalobacillus pseudalcaliphilus]